MADLQARIGPKVTKLYPNLTWKRSGADLQSPPEKSHEKEYDSNAFIHEHASSQTFSSPNKSRSDHQSGPSRHRQSSGPPSLLSRMGLGEDGASEGEEAASVQRSLLARVGTTEETLRSSPNIGSTWRDTVHVLDSNGYHDIVNSKHAQKSSPQPSLPSSLNSQGNAVIAENQPLDNRHNGTSQNNVQTKCNDGPVVEPPTKEAFPPESLHKSILHDSSKSNHSPSNIETRQTRLEDNLAAEKIITLLKFPPFQGQEFEEGELVDSGSLPSQQVRDLLLPLMLKNAAHRVKEGDSELSRHTAHSVLSDEVCSSFMDQMKEVRTEMYAHKNRSSHDPLQMQLTSEANDPGATHASSSSKIGQAPPSGPRAMKYPIKSGKFMPPNGEIMTNFSSSKDSAQPISAVSSHSHDPVSPSIYRRSEPGFRCTPSPERRGFHDDDRGRRYSQHRDPRFDSHRSHSPSRHSRGRPYYRPSDSSRRTVRSRSPVTLATLPRSLSPLPRRRRSPPTGASQSTYVRDRPLRESPEEISGRRSGSPPGTKSHDQMPEHRQNFSRDFKRIEGNISPRRDTANSPQSPVYFSSRKHFGRRGADKAVSPHRPSFTHDRGPGPDESPKHRKDNHVGIARSGSEFSQRSASPWREQHRQLSAERPRTPPRHLPQPASPNPYCQSPRKQASFEQRCREQIAYRMESLSPGAGSRSSHLTDNAAGSRHQYEKLISIDKQDMHGRVNEEVGMELPKTSDDMQQSGLSVLPCHNVPGIWFVKVALDKIGTLECSFEVDEVTALKWDLQVQQANVNLPKKEPLLRKEKLQLQICCLSQKLVQSFMDSLKPDATAQDVANTMVTIGNDWPTPGHLIIMVNPQNKNRRVWLPDKLESSCLPVCIEGCVCEGQNIVQFIQLSGMSERMFVLFASARPLLDGMQHDDLEEFVPAPLQNSIDGGKGDTLKIGFEKVTMSDLTSD